MTLFRKLFFVGVFSVAVPVYAQTDTLRLSRQECVAIALNESQTLKVADMEIKKADYSKKEVLANLFPAIDFTGAYQRAIELQSMNMSMGGNESDNQDGHR
ncbi:MAG: TolC family protein [Muribaculaceae bacterium]|nr:TolC family protein [Muribaculaceae bacterium]